MYEQYFQIFFDFLKAFTVGGLICMIAQVVINFTDLTAGKILVLFMLAGVVLQGLGLYQYLVEFAGAGATVPLTGFGYNLAKGVREAIDQDGFLGIFTLAIGSKSLSILYFILRICLLFQFHIYLLHTIHHAKYLTSHRYRYH